MTQRSLFPEFPVVDKLKRETGAKKVRFDGDDYKPQRDDVRLSGQLLRIFNLMRDGLWRTYADISRVTGDPETSISAQLRHLRKEKFGKHKVDRRYLGNGLYQYQLIRNTKGNQP